MSLASFLVWCEAQGCTISPKLDFVQTPERGIGAVIRAALSEGEPILSLPVHLLLDLDAVNHCPHASQFKDIGEKACDNRLPVILLLLHERSLGSGSKWHPYIDLLPKKIINAFSFTDYDRRSIAATALSGELDIMRKKCDVVLSAVQSASPPLDADIYTPEALEWAFSMFWSRALRVYHGSRALEALVPLADLFNHASSSHCEWQSSSVNFNSKTYSKKAISLIANADLPVNCEVCLKYGSYSNAFLLARFGFVEEHSAACEVFIRVNADEIEVKENREADLSKLEEFWGEGDQKTAQLKFYASELLPERTVAFARLFNESPSDLLVENMTIYPFDEVPWHEESEVVEYALKFPAGAKSRENEERALEWLAQRAQEARKSVINAINMMNGREEVHCKLALVALDNERKLWASVQERLAWLLNELTQAVKSTKL